jgi:hypothetical protein
VSELATDRAGDERLSRSTDQLYDRTVIGRIHPVSLWVPIGIFLSQLAVFVVISQTAAWRDFSGWLIR